MPVRLKTPVHRVPPTVIGSMMWEMAPAFQLLTLPTQPACRGRANPTTDAPERGRSQTAHRSTREGCFQAGPTGPDRRNRPPRMRSKAFDVLRATPNFGEPGLFETGPAGRSLGYHWMGVTGPP